MSLNNPIVDFQVLSTNDPRILRVEDHSLWGRSEEKPSIIEVIVPGYSSPIVLYFTKHGVTSLNSMNLSLNCLNGCEGFNFEELPDGIYEITVKASPDKFQKTRKHLRSDRLQLGIDLLYLNTDVSSLKKGKIKELLEAELLLRSAEAHVRYDDICSAQEMFFKAQDIVEKFSNCHSC